MPGDPHVVVIDWGDGSSTDVPLGAGVANFSGVTHPYPLNSVNQPGGVYAITATGTDTDGAALPGANASASITVDDIAPTVSGLVVTTDQGLSATTSLSTIIEGSTVFLTGHYTNPGGAHDSDTVMINWGDGTIDQAIVDPATLKFLDEHPYADLPAGTTSWSRRSSRPRPTVSGIPGPPRSVSPSPIPRPWFRSSRAASTRRVNRC